ncbi:target of Sbf [Lithohypha guttulata]|nr:target of Sbf [Lithohypha guttulata]
MKNILTTAVLVAASASGALAEANLINGNWYGKPVDKIVYTGWGQSGTYNKVTDMTNGQCKFEKVNYDGNLAPLNGEVSWHFRGPMHLKQFASYTPGSTTKRSLRQSQHQRKHGHAHGHQERAVGDIVTATINGDVVTWVNTFGGPPTDSPAAATPAAEAAKVASQAPKPSPTSAPKVNAGAGNWGRQAYYNAVEGTADGLVFLNNMGGQGSGVFDNNFGNSLSYAASDAGSGSSSPQVLGDILLGDNVEFSIYTDKPCEGNSCGYYRPGSVAHHGFGGDSKLFLLEFSAPSSNLKTGFNADMPAAWMLNAAIARTQQYGKCSCWDSGCGEWDIFEVLDAGNTRMKSTLHIGPNSGGESDYFERPLNKEETLKAAVIFDNANKSGHIMKLPSDTKFDATISDQFIADLGSNLAPELTKVFKLAS